MPALVVVLAVVAAALAVEPANAYRVTPNPVTTEAGWGPVHTALRTGKSAAELAGTTTTAQAGALARARTALGALPKLSTLGAAISVGAAGISVGWKIGRTIEGATGDTLYWHLTGDKFGTNAYSGTQSCGANCLYRAKLISWHWDGATATHYARVSTEFSSNGGTSWSGAVTNSRYWPAANTAMNAAVVSIVPALATVGSEANGVNGCTNNPCGQILMTEAAATTAVAGTPHVPWVAQSTSATTNITVPVVAHNAAPAVAAKAELLTDEAAAIEAAGTSAEEQTAAWDAGRTADPEWEGYATPEFAMPNCAGLTQAACTAELEAAGWTGTATVVELGRQGAVLTYGAGAVVTTTPAPGTSITTDTPVEYSTNPDPLPIALPSPLGGETYTQYLARLRGLGWLGTATVTVLSDPAAVPELGPDAPVTIETPIGSSTTTVQRVGAPWGSPRVFPDEPIEFTQNPPDLPGVPTTGLPVEPFLPPDSEGPDECECPIEPLDFTPLEVDHVCDKFPFGALCWIGDQVDLFGGGAEAPHVTFTHAAIETDLYTLPADTFRFDLDAADTPTVITDWFPIIRNILGFSIWLIGIWVLGRRMLGLQQPDATGATDGTWDESAGKYGGNYK